MCQESVPVDITVYLPDEIGTDAKAAGLNLSALLRQAVTEEMARLAALAAVAEPEEHLLDLEDDAGTRYKGRIMATRLGGDVEDIYLTDDGRVLAHSKDRGSYGTADADDEDAVDELIGLALQQDLLEYSRVMKQLGLRAIIDL